MQMRSSLVEMKHHVEHPEVRIAFLKALRKGCQSRGGTISVLCPAGAVSEISDLKYGLMKELLLLSLTYMLVVVWYLVPGLFLSGVVRSYSLIEQLMIHGFKIVVAKNHVQMSPFLVHVSSCERAVVVPDAALTGHSGDGDFHKNRSLQNS